MEQEDLGRLVGYQLKRVQAVLRAAMDAALREHDLTTPQYICLELLDLRPGLSNADLARDAFVTRQSMNVVLRNLHGAGLVTRPATAPHGRALPLRLTERARPGWRRPGRACSAVERRLTAHLDARETEVLLAQLSDMAESLSG